MYGRKARLDLDIRAGTILRFNLTDLSFFWPLAERFNIRRPAAFLLLGFIVAISVAQSLFLAALVVAPPKTATVAGLAGTDEDEVKRVVQKPESDTDRPSTTLLVSAEIAFFTIYLTPFLIPTPYFLANLLVMHVILLAPFASSPAKSRGITYQQLYALLSGFALALRIPTYTKLLRGQSFGFETIVRLAQELGATFLELPSQSSISSDVVASTLVFLIYAFSEVYRFRGQEQKSLTGKMGDLGIVVILSGVSAVAGIAVGGAAFLAWRESWKSYRGDRQISKDSRKDI